MAVRLALSSGVKMRTRTKLFAAAILLAGGLLSYNMPADELSDRARKLHFSSIVLDTHDDTPQRFFFQHFDLGHRDAEGHIDIPRMKEGGLNAIFFSIWCNANMTGAPATKRAFDLIDETKAQVTKHPQDLALATTAEEVRRAHAQGKIAALMGVEGGHMINNDLNVLRRFAALGVRYMTLTHTNDLDWAGSSGDDAKHIGLSPFGKDVVLEMNKLGVMVDISHVSDKTFWDALEVSRAPMIASHSSCRAICNAPRNMTDDMIKALAAKGGVIQINYHCNYLNTRKPPHATIDDVVAHIDHIRRIAGIDAIGIGSDFDGIECAPVGLDDVSKFPNLTRALLEKGYSAGDIRKIYGANLLRVMRAVEKAASK